MPKKTSVDRPKEFRMSADEPTPPLLSERLIAQLQGAVSAARRKRLSGPDDAGDRSDAEDL